MSLATIDTALQELADHARRVAASPTPNDDAFLTFQRLRSQAERAFAARYEDLPKELKQAIREVILEFQSLKERDFLEHPEVIATRIAGLALPAPKRSTTEDLLRSAGGSFAPSVGGKLAIPKFALGRDSLRKIALLASVLFLVVALILLGILLARAADGPDHRAQDSRDANAAASPPESQPADAEPTPALAAGKAHYADKVRLADREDVSLASPRFASLSFVEQIEALEADFSRQPQGVDLLEHLLMRAADVNAAWRREERPNALAEYIAREGNLAVYRSHEALLPSEVIASLGAEALPLGVANYYIAERLGLRATGFISGTRKGQARICPQLADGAAFLDGNSPLEMANPRSLEALREEFFERVLSREIDALSANLDVLLMASQHIVSEGKMRDLRKRLIAKLALAAGALSPIKRDLAARLLPALPLLEIPDREMPTLAALFAAQVPFDWLQSSQQRGLIFRLADGRANLEALAVESLARGERERGPLIAFLLAAADFTPERQGEIAATLGQLGVPNPALTIAESRARRPNPSAQVIDDYLRALVRAGDEILLLATILELLEYPERLLRAEVYARHGLALAISHRAWPQAEAILATADARWPESASFHRMAAEVVIGRGDLDAGVALLARYAKRWPADEAAARRLAEFAEGER